ncbi:Hypothetical Protein FCC1311_092762 [Hondaea fermentalgiana]|uniref:MRH domain-containing protein n=1 Tax=Hondaea fermentalgiana TaxID=2315210 RepID=A0A2R5GQA8_9STRA|nr:Hypothetical Protein FCC1311_092762 [Hondaea fermentalgiana]|eukprot:GBG33052.1 Hypothetical Protein FCC1311_092762 [Hondaea fermentalgiana]
MHRNITRKNARYASDQVDFVGAFEDLVAPATMIFSHGDVCAGEEKTSATVTFRCPRESELNITAVVASEKEEFCKTSYVIKTPWACSIPDATPFEQSACRQKSQDLAALQQAVEAQFAAFVMPDLIAYIDSSIDALLQMLAQEAAASGSSTSTSESGSTNPL